MKTLVMLVVILANVASAEWINLWPGDAPGAKPQAPAVEIAAKDGHFSNIAIPQYTLYLPDKTKATGAAVVVFPGGGYGKLASNSEGVEIAKWLNERGFVAIVVKYRVSSDASFGYQFPVPFLDARRAIRTVRAKAADWGVDPAKVGVIGFSAGGHLASLCATRFADTFPEEGKDDIDKQNCRPDFAMLIYPVISMDSSITHSGSRKNLLGDNPSPEMIAKYSTDKAVSGTTPPVFLVSTFGDHVVDCRNSLQFAEACRANNVPVTLHLFERGNHGYSLHGKEELDAWPQLLERWLATKFPGK